MNKQTALLKQIVVFLLLLFLVCPFEGRGSNPIKKSEHLITDHPGVTMSASTVPHGKLQTELKAGFESAGQGNRLRFPDLLFRYGLSTRFEMRLKPPSLVIHSRDGMNGPNRNGGERGIYPIGKRVYRRPPSFTFIYTDLSLGTKGIWLTAERWLFGFALELAFPVNKASIENGDRIGSVDSRGIFALRITDVTTLEGNLGLFCVVPGESSHSWFRSYVASLKLRTAFLKDFGAHVELYSYFYEKTSPYPALNAAVHARVSKAFTLGAFLGVGFVNISRLTDIFLGISAALRI